MHENSMPSEVWVQLQFTLNLFGLLFMPCCLSHLNTCAWQCWSALANDGLLLQVLL
jgi:hypothetical protein